MSHFTKSQIDEIQRRLATLSVRDSDLPETDTLTSDDFVAIVQDGENRRISVDAFGGGTKGEKGDDGKSAYELAVEEGYSGTLEEWLNSLTGEDGEPGVGISGVSYTMDAQGNTVVTFTMSDGTTQQITVNKGNDGQGSSVNVVDNLTSDSSTDALSAKQGKALKALIDALQPGTTTVVEDNLTSTSTSNALSANQGRVLYNMIQNMSGLNYQKVTTQEYESMSQAGTLQNNILYVIVDNGSR